MQSGITGGRAKEGGLVSPVRFLQKICKRGCRSKCGEIGENIRDADVIATAVPGHQVGSVQGASRCSAGVSAGCNSRIVSEVSIMGGAGVAPRPRTRGNGS